MTVVEVVEFKGPEYWRLVALGYVAVSTHMGIDGQVYARMEVL